jgi:DNA repair protein RadC
MTTAANTTGHRRRLRERFLAGETRALTEESLAELLLTFAIPQKDVQPLARALLQRFGSLQGLLDAAPEALRRAPGVGEATVALVQLVRRLAGRPPAPRPAPPTLFPDEEPDRAAPPAPAGAGPDGAARRKRPTRTKPAARPARTALRLAPALFSNALLREAIDLAPRLPDTESLDKVRAFVRGALHHSSQTTRERYAQYIARRLFPAGVADQALRRFARKFAGTQALRDVCFYRFLKAEPVVELCVRDLLIPAVGRGTLARATLQQYLAERFHDARPLLLEDTARGTSARSRSPLSC